MKECPECSMFNQDSASKCKFCGAHMGGGAASSPSESLASRIEDPAKRAEREKEERKKKIITYVGYGVIAAAAIGWLVYSYVKKSKEPPPEEGAAGEVAQEGMDDEGVEGEAEEAVVEEEVKSIPLGKAVTLEDVGLTFLPFADPVIEAAGDGAAADPDLLFKASTEDGVISLSIHRSENPDGANPPSGPKAAQMQADYVLSKGRPVIIPGKKKGKSKAGPYIMYEADLGQVFERIYYVFTEKDRVDFLFSYPASGEDVTAHEKLIHNIMASMKPIKEAAAVEKPAEDSKAVEDKPAKPAEPKPEKPAEAKPEKPEKAPPKPAAEKKPAKKEAD